MVMPVTAPAPLGAMEPTVATAVAVVPRGRRGVDGHGGVADRQRAQGPVRPRTEVVRCTGRADALRRAGRLALAHLHHEQRRQRRHDDEDQDARLAQRDPPQNPCAHLQPPSPRVRAATPGLLTGALDGLCPCRPLRSPVRLAVCSCLVLCPPGRRRAMVCRRVRRAADGRSQAIMPPRQRRNYGLCMCLDLVKRHRFRGSRRPKRSETRGTAETACRDERPFRLDQGWIRHCGA